MTFPSVTAADWRAQVDKDLAGGSFEKLLVHEAIEGLAIAPLYTETPPGGAVGRETRGGAFRICMRQEPGGKVDDAVADIAGGAEALWTRAGDVLDPAMAPGALARTFLVLDSDEGLPFETLEAVAARVGHGAEAMFALNGDPLGQRAMGRAALSTLREDLGALGRVARAVDDRYPGATAAMVSTLAYHDAGADAADELAIALSTGALYLETLLESGLSVDQAARQIAVQIAVGRDTFLELCKLRALRVCWQKLLAAARAPAAPRTLVHAVCSSRTLSVRDPWVNMLRVTTQVFSAILGGADLITPAAFDQASGAPSALGRRVARNTGLVLREESYLGKVIDPAGGSYYLETLTDALARQAWRRFQTIEREGGIADALESGRLLTRLEAAWHTRLEQIAKRKTPMVGVSDFANLDEKLPRAVPAADDARRSGGALPVHRDAAAFEELRLRAESRGHAPQALLVTLGTLSESRPRVGFAASFFAAGGIRTRETTSDERAPLVCLCSTDERYGAEGALRVRTLKAAGCSRVLVAGRPGALEASLRDAGVDGFVFAGCDVVAVLSELLDGAT